MTEMRAYDEEITLRGECQRLVEQVAWEVDQSSEACIALRLTAAMVESSEPLTEWLTAVRRLKALVDRAATIRSDQAASSPSNTNATT